MKKIIKNAFIDAGAVIFYIILVAILLTTQSNFMENNILSGVMMILILTISVAMMGIFIFGRPALWYLEGEKKAAVSLLGYTIGFLSIAFIVIFILLVVKANIFREGPLEGLLRYK